MSTSPSDPPSTPGSQDAPGNQDAPGSPDAKDSPVTPEAGSGGGLRHPFLLYNLLRLAIFLAVLGVCYLFGFRGLPLLAVALLVSGAVSFVVLNRIGGSAAASIGGMVHRLGERIDAGARSEDDD